MIPSPARGRTRNAVYMTEYGESTNQPKYIIVSSYTRFVARMSCNAGNMSVGCPLPGRASSRDTTYPIPVNKFRRDDALPQQGTRTAVGSRTTGRIGTRNAVYITEPGESTNSPKVAMYRYIPGSSPGRPASPVPCPSRGVETAARLRFRDRPREAADTQPTTSKKPPEGGFFTFRRRFLRSEPAAEILVPEARQTGTFRAGSGNPRTRSASNG